MYIVGKMFPIWSHRSYDNAMVNNKLHTAVQSAFSELGIEIMLSTKFVYAILDFGGFNEFPATRQIVRDVIVEGYSQRLYDIYKHDHPTSLIGKLFSGSNSSDAWKIQSQTYIVDFIKKTGYNDDLVNYVFHSILFGLGYISQIQEPKTQNPKTVPLPISGNNTSAVSNTNMKVPVHVNVAPPFTPQVNTQFLVVTFQPIDATLYIDGIEQTASYGKWADELPVGQHVVFLKASAYKSKTETINLTDTEKQVLDVHLELYDSSTNVSFQAETNDTEIWIDGENKGYGKWSGLLTVGSHSVICRRERCYDYAGEHIISPQTVTIDLPKLQQIVGGLKVIVTPIGSKVYLDGQEKGETPLFISDVFPGLHSLKVVNVEGTVLEESINIEENQVAIYKNDIPSIYRTDYDQVEIGDWFYEDGTYTREAKAIDKKCVGIVISKQTSEEEKKHGWTHGLILSIDNVHCERINLWNEKEVERFEGNWCEENVHLPFPHVYISKDEIMNSLEINYEDTAYIEARSPVVYKNEKFGAFHSCQSHISSLPIGKTSGWYLPSFAQLLIAVKQFAEFKRGYKEYTFFYAEGVPKDRMDTEVLKRLGSKSIPTSTSLSEELFVDFYFRSFTHYDGSVKISFSLGMSRKLSSSNYRAVASF